MSPTKHTLRPPLIDTPPEENEITLQEWSRQLKANGPLLPGPTIPQAQKGPLWLADRRVCRLRPHRARPIRINPTPARNANRGPITGLNLHALRPKRAADRKNPRRRHPRRHSSLFPKPSNNE